MSKGIYKRTLETKLKLSNLRKGKSHEEFYGIEKSILIKNKIRNTLLGIKSNKRGKTFEELYGDKSEIIKKKISNSLIGRYVGDLNPSKQEGVGLKISKSLNRKNKNMEEIYGKNKAIEIKTKITNSLIKTLSSMSKKDRNLKFGSHNLNRKQSIEEIEKRKLSIKKSYTPRLSELRRINKIKYIEKTKLDGMPLHPTLGKNEKYILDILEEIFNYKIIRQYKVRGFFLDGYCPALNLAIEVDEYGHKFNQNKDDIREQEIKIYLNCKFIRIRDFHL